MVTQNESVHVFITVQLHLHLTIWHNRRANMLFGPTVPACFVLEHLEETQTDTERTWNLTQNLLVGSTTY